MSTLSCESGTITTTGQALTLNYLVIDCETQAFYVRGQDVVLLHNKQIDLLRFDYQTTGFDATLSLNRQVLEYGAFHVQEQPVSFKYNKLLSAESGAYLLTGQDANLVLAIGLLSATGGTFTLSGQDANLRHLLLYQLALASGTITASGSDLTPTYNQHLLATTVAEFIIDVYTN